MRSLIYDSDWVEFYKFLEFVARSKDFDDDRAYIAKALESARAAAVGSSLFAVTTFGLTTAANYALSGLIDWPLAGIFVGGGVVGSFLGTRAAKRLSGAGHLTTIFAWLIFAVAAYMLWKSGSGIYSARFS